MNTLVTVAGIVACACGLVAAFLGAGINSGIIASQRERSYLLTGTTLVAVGFVGFALSAFFFQGGVSHSQRWITVVLGALAALGGVARGVLIQKRWRAARAAARAPSVHRRPSPRHARDSETLAAASVALMGIGLLVVGLATGQGR